MSSTSPLLAGVAAAAGLLAWRLRTIDDAAREAPGWRAAFGYEFLDRPDGYAGLARAYGIRLAEPPRSMAWTPASPKTWTASSPGCAGAAAAWKPSP